MNKAVKILNVIQRYIIKKLVYINESVYMKYYLQYLKNLGVKIQGEPKYISPDVYIDGKDYKRITICDNSTISREVMLLTHDYSLTNAISSQKKVVRRGKGELFTIKEITIGKNVFIGARASILPGTIIGEGSIIGAGSVVKGVIPSGVIVIGNPCKIIGKVSDYANKIITKGEWYKDKVKQ